MTFTSAAAVLNFAANVGADQASDLLGHTVVATLGAPGIHCSPRRNHHRINAMTPLTPPAQPETDRA